MQQARLQHPRRFHPSGPTPYALADSVYINRPSLDQPEATNQRATDTINETDPCLTNA
jgi:hypothetical protein